MTLELAAGVRTLVAELARWPAEELHEDTSLLGDDGLGLDSLAVLELVVALDERYGVELRQQDGEAPLRTLGSLIAFVGSRSK